MARAKNTVHSCRLSLSSIRALLPAARSSRMPTRKRRNMVLGYYKYSFSAGIRNMERKKKNKTKRAAQRLDDEKKEARLSGVAAKPIPSDSLFIFRRVYFRLTLCLVCIGLFYLYSCGAIFENVIEQSY